MPRARNIKHSFFKNDLLAEIPPLGRLLFAGLWTMADREGRLEDRHKRIRSEIMSYDDCDIDGLLNSLAKHGFIERYVVDGIGYIQICKFKSHQHPHRNEPPSALPAPGQHSASTVQATNPAPELTDAAPADSYNLITDSCNLIKPDTTSSCQEIDCEESKPAKQKKPGKFDECPAEFETAWQAYPRRPGASKKEAWQAWLARRRDGVDATLMVDGVKRYAAYIAASGQAPKFVKHAATFFGPYEHYKADWSMPADHAPPASSKHTGFANTNYAQGIAQDGSF
ncbi:hypothetical protein UNDYM_4206 [Undibacterium sp. YM2]|nr:hypothetical protein UNDYM_4206 [Undibacterium sp. YM2]